MLRNLQLKSPWFCWPKASKILKEAPHRHGHGFLRGRASRKTRQKCRQTFIISCVDQNKFSFACEGGFGRIILGSILFSFLRKAKVLIAMGSKNSSSMKKSFVIVGALVLVAAVIVAVVVVMLQPGKRPKPEIVEVVEEQVVVKVQASDDVVAGKLMIDNGLCAMVAEDSRVYMRPCNEAPWVRLTKGSRMMIGDRCVSVHENAYVMVEPCDPADNHQGWQFESTGRLRNEWSQYCAMHVTNPEHPEDRQQVVMAQPCDQDHALPFLKWTFYTGA